MTISESLERYFIKILCSLSANIGEIVVRFDSNRDTLEEYINRQSGLHRANHVSQVQTVFLRTTSVEANVAIKR